jgi:hypothetical protein
MSTDDRNCGAGATGCASGLAAAAAFAWQIASLDR